MRLVCLIVVCLLAGCSSSPPTSAPTPKQPDAVSTFFGTPAKKRIDWDLSGTWNVNRFGTEKKPQKGDRWEAKWMLKEAHGNRQQTWLDRNSGGVWRLVGFPIDNVKGVTKFADVLVWDQANGERMCFSINDQRFGYLEMTDEHGEQYMAVRTDGPDEPKKEKPKARLDGPCDNCGAAAGNCSCGEHLRYCPCRD